MRLTLNHFVQHARGSAVPGAWLLAAALLTGCASTRLIDSEVNSFAGATPAPTNATFRFERLPSDAGSTEQDSIESLAKPVLSKAGLVLTQDHPAYSVQLQLSTLRLLQDPRNTGYPMQFGVPPGWRAGGFGLFADIPWYHNTLQLVVRDLASGNVAYQSSAVFESPWSDIHNIYPAMLEAALQGYPTPAAGPRTVVIELAPKDNNR